MLAPLVRATKLVDEIIEVDEKKLLTGPFLTKFFQLFTVWKQVGFRFFDQIFTLHSDPRYRLLSFFSLSPEKKSWGKTKGRSLPLVGRYHVYEALHLLNSEQGPLLSEFEFPEIDCSLPSEKQDLFSTHQPTVVIAPGGAKNLLADDALRRWPIESYATVVEELAKHGYKIFVIGASSDEWVLPMLPKEQFHSLIGRLTLLETIAFLKNADLLITHDTGPLHLAKLARCQAIGLFGPTNPFSRTAPQEKIHVIWGGEHLSCRPCYNGKTYAPCKKNDCLTSLSAARVVQTAKDLLQGH